MNGEEGLDIGRAPKRRGSSWSVVIAFVLGLGVGVTLTYAFLAEPGKDAAHQAAAPSQTPPTETSSPPEESPPEASPTVASGPDLEGLWPARHLFIGLPGLSLDDDLRTWLGEYRPGGVMLTTSLLSDAAAVTAFIAELKRSAGLGRGLSDPPLVAADAADNPFALEDWLSPRALAEGGDAEAIEAAGARLGQAALERDIALVLGPFMGVYQEGVSENYFVDASFGTTSWPVAQAGLSFAQAAHDTGPVPVLRTFPGMASAAPQVEGRWVIEETDPTRLAKLVFPFAEGAKRKMPAILVGPIAVPGLDKRFPERAACQSPAIIGDVLRGTLEFNGLVIAEDPSPLAVRGERTVGEAVVVALAAGADAVILDAAGPGMLTSVCEAMHAALSAGVLTREGMDEKKARIEAVQALLAPIDEQRPPPEDETSAPSEEPAAAEVAVEPPPEPPAKDEAAPESPAKEEDDAPTPQPEDEASPIEDEAPEQTPPAEDESPGETPPDTPEEAPAEKPEGPAEAAPSPPKETPAEEAAPPETGKKDEVAETPQAPKPIPQPPNTKAIEHTVAAGETLTRLGSRYGVAVSEIMAWNALEDEGIQSGKRLKVYLPVAVEESTDPAPETDAEKETEKETEKENDATEEQALVDYVVAPGDTLKKIATRFGTTQRELMRRNGITDPDIVQLGQRLKVPKAPE